MRIVLVALLVLLATPLAAAPAASPAPDPTVATLARLSGKAFDVAYLRLVIPAHEESVEVAMAATLWADHTDLLKWNQRMIERKNAQVRQMLTVLTALGAAPTQRAVGVVTPTVKKVRALRGGALERTYMNFLITQFERNVALSRMAAAKGGNAEVKALGAAIVKVEATETTMLRGWLKKWYP
ncbi:MAG TPA: DUF305 domain-containing protein [bacterium]|jgi:uncharacterized protein (DUF305 family)|nr:DUF305 domain-containing protein [bacterium]